MEPEEIANQENALHGVLMELPAENVNIIQEEVPEEAQAEVEIAQAEDENEDQALEEVQAEVEIAQEEAQIEDIFLLAEDQVQIDGPQVYPEAQQGLGNV